MEQIKRYIYKGIDYKSADNLYDAFRYDYTNGTGRAFFKRLNRLKNRTERIHGFGMYFSESFEREDFFKTLPKSKYRLLGMLQISYARIIGLHDMPKLDEKDLEDWVDWAFSYKSNALSLVGKNDKSGRTKKAFRKLFK